MFGGLDSRHFLMAVGIAIEVAAAVAVHLRVRNRVRRVVRGRVPLGAVGLSALFATDAEAVLAPIIRDRLRSYLLVDPALVHPDDRLCDELQLAAIDGLDANAFVAEIEKVAGMRIPDDDAQRLFTLRDIVAYVAARKQ